LVFSQYWGIIGGSGFELTVCPEEDAILHRLSSDDQIGEWYVTRLAAGAFSNLSASVDALRGAGEFRVCPDAADFYVRIRQPALYLKECSEKIEESRFGPLHQAVGKVISSAAWQRLPAGKPPIPCGVSTALAPK